MKMKKMRKGVAAILAIALLITLTPVMALTDDEPDTETLLTNAECVVSSETANTQDAVTNWIKANWLLGISGLNDVLGRDYGVEISDLKMTTPTDPFKAAENGTVESPEGSAGQFKFSVVVPGADGVGAQLTVQKTCTITPKKYTPQIQVKSTVLSPAIAGESYNFSLDSLLANGFSADLVSWTKPSTTLLPEGLTFSAEDGKISGTPTTAGTYILSGIKANVLGDVYQANEFTFTLVVNDGEQYPRPVISAFGETVELNNGVVYVDNGKSVQLEANLSQNAPAHSLQWQVKQEGASAFVNFADATTKGVVIDSADYPNDTQFRCVATYSGSEVRESVPVTIRHRIAATASVTGTVATENGTPLYGRDIELIDGNNNLIGKGEIGENGEYSISNVPDGDYFFNISGVEKIENGSLSVAEGNVTGNTNFAIPVRNIEGATSTVVPIPGGENASIEFVSGGSSPGGLTVATELYPPTAGDITAVVESAYPGADVNMGKDVDVPKQEIRNNKLSVSGNGISHTFEKIGEIIQIGEDKYLVRDIQEEKVKLIKTKGDRMVDNSPEYLLDRNGIIEENDERTFLTYHFLGSSMIRIGGVSYVADYELRTDMPLKNIAFISLPNSPEPAGAIIIDKSNNVSAVFNKDCDPDSLRKQELQQQFQDYLALVNAGNGLQYNVMNAFSYDINILGGRARSSGAMGTIGISGIENADKSISVHLGSSGRYDEGKLNTNGDGFIWTVSETSPFMIFTFTEVNMEIPVTVIDTESAQKKVSPKTSDNMNMAVWGLLALGSGTFMTRTYIKRRKYGR